MFRKDKLSTKNNKAEVKYYIFDEFMNEKYSGSMNDCLEYFSEYNFGNLRIMKLVDGEYIEV